MKRTKKIAPSILSCDFKYLEKEIKAVESADLVHLDVMDGHFVPNITIGPMIVEAVRKCTRLPLDTHLMITNPEKYVERFIEAGSDMISFHIEVCKEPEKIIDFIKSKNKKAGIVLNPDTHVSEIVNVLDKIDFVLVMSVFPGFGGQKFIESSIPKIKEIAKIRDEKGLEYEIEIDGGIKLDNVLEVAKAGCDIFVSGTGIFGTDNYEETIVKMRNIAKKE